MSSEKSIIHKKSVSQMNSRTEEAPQIQSENEADNTVKLPSGFENYVVMPFHHLIPAALLELDSSFLHEPGTSYRMVNFTARST